MRAARIGPTVSSAAGAKNKIDGRVARAIDRLFEEDETQTHREAAEKPGMDAATFWKYATEEMDHRCLDVKLHPFLSEDNREKRVEMGREIAAEEGPAK